MSKKRVTTTSVLTGDIVKSRTVKDSNQWIIPLKKTLSSKGFMPGYSVFTTDGDKLLWQRRNFEWQCHLEPEDTLERQRIAEREIFEKQQAELREQEISAGRK